MTVVVLKVRAVHGVALNMLRGHLRALGHCEELALQKVGRHFFSHTFKELTGQKVAH